MLDSKRPLKEITFVAFDTETTGTGPGTRLVEIAGSRFSVGTTHGTFQTLIDPEQPIPPEAQEINQISDSMVRGQPKASRALEDFFAFAEGAVLVAHNAGFDAGVIGLELLRHRIGAPEFMLFDSLKLTRRLYPSSSHSLDALVEILGLPPQEARHRALADAELVRHLIERAIDVVGGPERPLSALLEHHGALATLADHRAKPARFSPDLALLDRACQSQTKVKIEHDVGGGKLVTRIIAPRVAYDWEGDGFVEAFCAEEGLVRVFRLDRIKKAVPGASSGFLFA